MMELFLIVLNSYELFWLKMFYIVFHIYWLNNKCFFKFLKTDDDISQFDENDGLWGKYFVSC